MLTSTSRVCCCVLFTVVFLGLTTSVLSAATLYVATDGNDAWSGNLERPKPDRTDGPLASLAGARNAVRRLKANGPIAEPVRILVAAGTYPLAEPLSFGPQDSGTAEAPIVYQAADGARPVFTGGRRIQDFKRAEGGLWKVHLPEVQADKNILRSNIFAFSMEGQLQRTRVEPHLSFTFSNNIVYFNQGQLLSSNWKDANVKMEDNLYFNASGAPVKFVDMDFVAWQASGKDAGSIVADPKFVDATHFDFRLQPDSPAHKIGFKSFDYTKAGVYGDASWVKEAAAITYPPVRFAPDPPKP